MSGALPSERAVRVEGFAVAFESATLACASDRASCRDFWPGMTSRAVAWPDKKWCMSAARNLREQGQDAASAMPMMPRALAQLTQMPRPASGTFDAVRLRKFSCRDFRGSTACKAHFRNEFSD